MVKHTKTFYRAIARMRAVNRKDGFVFLHRLKSKLGLSYVRASKLKDELVKAGILFEWDEVGRKGYKGNINWKNLSKFKVPREIIRQEKERIKKEREKGLI
ncbi:MAG: hypothetical protein KatS3mg088_100 [Patescibacteria group bacterium]|nr:MAG: hypothetical protein KatS3mg088_100 [Patescibacteria group bacterium]